MTKFKMDVKELAESIGVIAPCVAAKDSVIKITLLNKQTKNRDAGEGNLIMFLCYDEKKQIATFSAAREVEMEENTLEMYVDGKSFSALAAVLGQREGFAQFEVDKHMTVDGANSRVNFALLDETATLAREKSVLYRINIDTPRLRAILRRGGYAYLSDSKSQVNMRYVALKFDKEAAKITVCSSNGNMFAIEECSHVTFEDTEYPEKSKMVLVEGEQLKSVLKALTDEHSLIEVYGNQMLIKNGLNVCILRTADESYPLEGILNLANSQKQECEIKVSVAELLKAIDIINIVKTENVALCTIKDLGNNRICLHTSQGNGKTEIEVQKKNSFTEVSFNADYFKSIISNYDKGAELFLAVGKPEEALLIKKEKEYAGLSCLLPVKQ